MPDFFNLTQKTDEELMKIYQGGEHRAFDELYKRYSKKLYGYLVKKLSKIEDAQEVYQNVFLKLHKSKFQFKCEQASKFSYWFFTIAHSSAMDFLRSQKSKECNSVNDEKHSLQGNENSLHENLDFISHQGLSAKERKVVALKLFREDDYHSIGQMMKISEAAARKLFSRGILKIKNKFY